MASRASSTSRAAASGAVDEDTFTRAFEDVPTINVSSAKEVNEKFSKIKEILADGSQDWEKRISALKEIRSLVIAGAPDLIDIVAQLRILDPGFQLSVKDLRSQVVREACITVAFLAVRLEHRFEFNAETLMPILVALIQNSAKVMSTSGTVAIRFIVKNTHSSRLIPPLVTHVSSKSNIIRKQCLMFLDLLLNTWPRQAMERHASILQEAIKKGLSDADADARMHSRRAFRCFAEHFREQAFALLNTFDATKQRQLLAELDDPSIFNDLKKTSRSKSTERTTSSGIQSSWRHTAESGGDGGVGVALSTPDLIPIQKPESTMRRNNSLRGGPSATPSLGVYKIRKNSVTSVEQGHRSRTTSKGISQSQPGSRSGSPSSRLVYVSNLQPDVASTAVKASSTLSRLRPRRKTANSQGSSREGSPDRKLGHDFKAGVQSLRQASGRVSPSPRKASLTLQCMAEYGKDLETHISDALRQRRFRSDDGSDAASETSSVCSENSLRSGPDGLLSDDVAEVMALLLSGSWADRREGLVMLQRILRSERRLAHSELKRVTEVFTRMFHDPHSKVMSVFLEAFVDFVTAHSCDLTDWFPVCLTRLLAKAGSDVLGSMQSKITRALDALRDSFPHHHQFACVTRFIVEQAQIPNVKVKLVLLTYLQGLICQMEPSCFSNNSDTRLAVSRVITWTSEPKSPEVRKAAQNVLIALMHLNSAELSIILSVLPKSFQEGATKVLSGVVQLSPGDSAKIQASRNAFAAASTPGRVGMRSRSSLDSSDGAEVFNAEDVYNGIKKASEDIQHLSLLGRQLDLSLAKQNLLEQDGGLAGDFMVTSESIEEILVELSSADNALEQRLKALNQLMSVIKKCHSEELWNKHFKMVLLLLLETMRDESGKVRSSCLLALKELLDAQPEPFRPYAELTILSLLEFEKDTDREVLRAAEDCGGALAKAISTEQAISILNPISLTADFPINLAAIKLETKVVEAASEANLRTLMPDMIPGLIKGFENAESSVRKTSMLCLLSIYRLVGESLMSQLTTLHPSKMKLLNLYIKRTEEQKGRTGMNFEPVSPT